MKHFMIAARSGWNLSLEPIKHNGYMLGIVSKDEFAETLRAVRLLVTRGGLMKGTKK